MNKETPTNGYYWIGVTGGTSTISFLHKMSILVNGNSYISEDSIDETYDLSANSRYQIAYPAQPTTQQEYRSGIIWPSIQDIDGYPVKHGAYSIIEPYSRGRADIHFLFKRPLDGYDRRGNVAAPAGNDVATTYQLGGYSTLSTEINFFFKVNKSITSVDDAFAYTLYYTGTQVYNMAPMKIYGSKIDPMTFPQNEIYDGTKNWTLLYEGDSTKGIAGDYAQLENVINPMENGRTKL